MTSEAPTDGAIFVAYLAQMLCPKLRPGRRGGARQSVHAQGGVAQDGRQLVALSLQQRLVMMGGRLLKHIAVLLAFAGRESSHPVDFDNPAFHSIEITDRCLRDAG